MTSLHRQPLRRKLCDFNDRASCTLLSLSVEIVYVLLTMRASCISITEKEEHD